jgi:hypothetical protein
MGASDNLTHDLTSSKLICNRSNLRSKQKLMLSKFFAMSVLLISATFAHAGNGTENRLVHLENQNLSLQKQIQNLNYRLSIIEQILHLQGSLVPPTTEAYKTTCLVTDSGYSNVFLGEGRNKLTPKKIFVVTPHRFEAKS